QAAVWLARGGALVTMLHRRSDLQETMSDYLIRELERYGVAVRDRSEIAALHGADGHLEAVTLKNGEHLPFSVLFSFLCARPSPPRPTRSGSCTQSPATPTASSPPAPPPTPTTCPRPVSRASLPPATPAAARRNAAPPPSAKDRWPCSSSTHTSPRLAWFERD